MKNRPKKILVCGNYGAANLGDEAILAGIIKLIESTFPGAAISVMSADKRRTEKEFRVNAVNFFPAGLRSFLKFWFLGQFIDSIKALFTADLVILGGGGLFSDERKAAVWIWFVQACWFYLFGKKVVCLAQSVGPLKSKWAKLLTGWVFKKAILKTVRDEKSLNLLNSIGVKGVAQLADPAFALAYEIESQHKISNNVVISLRQWKPQSDQQRYDIIKNLSNYLREKHELRAIFVPFQDRPEESDLYCYEFIKDQVELRKVDDFKHALEIISRAKLVVGMRLHSIIMAVLARRPFVAISYSKKVKDFVETLGLGEMVIDYDEINLKDLKRLVDLALDQENRLVEVLEKQKLKQVYEFYKHEKLLKEVL